MVGEEEVEAAGVEVKEEEEPVVEVVPGGAVEEEVAIGEEKQGEINKSRNRRTHALSIC